MIEILFIIIALVLMCTSLHAEDVLSNMTSWFDASPASTRAGTNVILQAMDIRAGKPGSYHRYAHQLASSDEGPEYMIALLEVDRVCKLIDGEVISIERTK